LIQTATIQAASRLRWDDEVGNSFQF